jgi:hypothetical protein
VESRRRPLWTVVCGVLRCPATGRVWKPLPRSLGAVWRWRSRPNWVPRAPRRVLVSTGAATGSGESGGEFPPGCPTSSYVAQVLAKAATYRGAPAAGRAWRSTPPACASCCATRGSSSLRSSKPNCAPARSTRAWSRRWPRSAAATPWSSRRCDPITAPAPTMRPAARSTSAPSTGDLPRHPHRRLRAARARARRRARSTALNRADLLLGPRRSRRPARVRARRPLRPPPLGHGRMNPSRP